MLILNRRMTSAVVNRLAPPGDGDILVPVHTVCILGTTDITVPDPDDARGHARRGRRAARRWRTAGPRALAAPGCCAPMPARGPCTTPPSSRARSTTTSRARSAAPITSSTTAARDGVGGMWSIVGGKLTTYRLMARDVVDAVATVAGRRRAVPHGRRGAARRRPAAVRTGSATGWRRSRRSGGGDAELVCECELVTRATAGTRPSTERADSSLDDLRRTTRLGMGPCQGAFCIPRAAAALDARGRSPGAGGARRQRALRDFVAERFRGTRPIAWGDQLAELWLADRHRARHPRRGSACRCGPRPPAEHADALTSSSSGPAWPAWRAPPSSPSVARACSSPPRGWRRRTGRTAGSTSRRPTAHRRPARRRARPRRDSRAPRTRIAQPRRSTPAVAAHAGATRSRGPRSRRHAGRRARPDPHGHRRAPPRRRSCRTAQAAALEPWAGDGLLLVGIGRYRDAWPAYAARNLAARPWPDGPARDPRGRGRAPRPGEASATSTRARWPSASTTPDWRAAHLRRSPTRSRAGAWRVGMPAVLGLRGHARRSLRRPRARWAAGVFEIPSLPPSVPGLRLFEALRAASCAAGGRIQIGFDVVDVERNGGRVIAIHTEAASRDAAPRRPTRSSWPPAASAGPGSARTHEARCPSASSGCRSRPRRVSLVQRRPAAAAPARGRRDRTEVDAPDRRGRGSRARERARHRLRTGRDALPRRAMRRRRGARHRAPRGARPGARTSGRMTFSRRGGPRVPALQHRRLHQVQRVHDGLPGQPRDRCLSRAQVRRSPGAALPRPLGRTGARPTTRSTCAPAAGSARAPVRPGSSSPRRTTGPARRSLPTGARSLRNRLISDTDLLIRLGANPLAPLANFGLRNRFARWMGEKVLGVHRRGPLAPFSRRTFRSWWRRSHAARRRLRRAPIRTGPSSTSMAAR